MAALLGDDVTRFLDALGRPRTRGLRLNPAKVDRAGLELAVGTTLTPVPWCPNGFTTTPDIRLGGRPAHVAGLYYLQEPSAMAVAEALDPRPGWRVADLAAAPGGKTTHLAALVGPSGLVLANEVSATRLRTLHESLDLWGGANVVTSQTRLSDLTGRYDGVVLDAPCSGEGLFRRKPDSVRHWSPAAVAGAARRQDLLLADAARLVRPEGVLVYSTCTFGREENEDRVVSFLERHPGWSVERAAIASTAGIAPGLDSTSTSDTMRLWPHLVEGEGQYVARLRAPSTVDAERTRRAVPRAPGGRDVREAWTAFRRTYLPNLGLPDGPIVVRGDTAYLTHDGLDPDRLARPGLPLGRARPGRFVPAHALATSVTPDAAATRVHWDTGDRALREYLTGNVVAAPGPDGWVLVCWRDWPVGWAKRTDGTLKNQLPDHVRRLAAP